MADLASIHSYEGMRFWLGGQLGAGLGLMELLGTTRTGDNGGKDCHEINSNWNDDFYEKTWNDRSCDHLNSEDMGFVCKK